MADATNNKIDMSAIAFDLAKEKGFGSDEVKFKEWEKDLVKIVGREYVGLGLVGPDQFVRLTL